MHRVLAQIYRLRIAEALVVCDEIQQQHLWAKDAARWSEVFEPLASLHAGVLAVLAAVKEKHEGSISVRGGSKAVDERLFTEGFLQTLERDLGEALTVKSSERIEDNRLRGVFRAFAHEHFTMHSASSVTACRTTYTSKQQVESRFRFVRGVVNDATKSSKRDAVVNVLEACFHENGLGSMLSEDELNCRRDADDLACFYSLDDWRECILGIAFNVRSKTLRDRQYGLPPQVDIVADYVSAEVCLIV